MCHLQRKYLTCKPLAKRAQVCIEQENACIIKYMLMVIDPQSYHVRLHINNIVDEHLKKYSPEIMKLYKDKESLIMEIKIYFAVKVLCAVFILYRLWIFIFSQQVYDAWEKVYRMMRIARIKLWKYRKEYRIYKGKRKLKKPGKRQDARKMCRKQKWYGRSP